MNKLVTKLATSAKTSSSDPFTANFTCWNFPLKHSFISWMQKVTFCSQLPATACRRSIWGNIIEDHIIYNNDVDERNSCSFFSYLPLMSSAAKQNYKNLEGKIRDLTLQTETARYDSIAVQICISLGKWLARRVNQSLKPKQTEKLPHKTKPKKPK